MKRKISIGLIIVAIVMVIYFMLTPSKISDDIETQPASLAPEASLGEAAVPDMTTAAIADQEQQRLKKMQAMYSQLEASRKRLKSRLGRLKATAWKQKLPAEQNDKINNDLGRVYFLLKNPPLLGAFRDVEDIEKELDKIEGAHQSMDEIEKLVNNISG